MASMDMSSSDTTGKSKHFLTSQIILHEGLVSLQKGINLKKKIYDRRATLADSLLTSGSLAHPAVPRPINTVAAG